MAKGNEGRKLLECGYCGRRSPLSTGECPGCGHDLGLYGVIVIEKEEETESSGAGRQKRKKVRENPVHREPVHLPVKTIAVIVLLAVLLSGIGYLAFRMGQQIALRSGDPRETAAATMQTQPATTAATVPTETMMVPTTLPVETTAATQPPVETTEPVVSGGQLMRDYAVYTDKNEYEGTCFGGKMDRISIKTITFLDSVAKAPGEAWDASASQDGSVLCWLKPNGALYDLYIAGDGGVVLPANCDTQFAGFGNLTRINGTEHLRSDYTTSMQYMFANCSQLEEIDLRSFNTENVTTLKGLFYNCHKLRAVDISSFNTSRVTSIRSMFYDCYRLESVDFSGFDTANVTDMSYLFRTCRSLTELDLSGFDTSRVTNMQAMFNSCLSLKKLNMSSFNTAKVTDVSWMFCGCYAKTARDVEHLDFSRVTSYERFMDGSNWSYLFEN